MTALLEWMNRIESMALLIGAVLLFYFAIRRWRIKKDEDFGGRMN